MQTSRQRGRDAFTAQLIPSGHSDGSWQTLPYQKLQWEEKWWGKKSQHLKEGWRRDAKRLQDVARRAGEETQSGARRGSGARRQKLGNAGVCAYGLVGKWEGRRDSRKNALKV